jgi:hypothetical protein
MIIIAKVCAVYSVFVAVGFGFFVSQQEFLGNKTSLANQVEIISENTEKLYIKPTISQNSSSSSSSSYSTGFNN